MLKIITLGSLLLLTACNSSSSGPNIDQRAYDLHDANSDLKVQFQTPARQKLDYFTDAWHSIQSCSGLSRWPAPFVVIVDDSTITHDGRYYPNENLILIRHRSANHLDLLKHEMLHALLAPDHGHTSTLFNQCAPNAEGYDKITQ